MVWQKRVWQNNPHRCYATVAYQLLPHATNTLASSMVTKKKPRHTFIGQIEHKDEA
jgi:hypothetical protein